MVTTMSPSFVQDRIGQLCSRAIVITDPEELEKVIAELRATLREQVDHLHTMVDVAKQTIAQLPAPFISERRTTERRKGQRRRSQHSAAGR